MNSEDIEMPELDLMSGDADTVQALPAPPELQLRVLSGMHAGASAPLTGDHYTLGTLDDCDFVLADAGVQPHHARLSRCAVGGADETGWQLDWVAQGGGEPLLAPVQLIRGKAVPLGPLVVTVDDAQAPWPTLEQLVLVPHAPALEPQLPQPAPQASLSAVAALLRGIRLRAVFTQRRAVASTAAAVAVGLCAVVLLAWPVGQGQGRGAAAGGAIAAVPPGDSPPGSPDAAHKKVIEAALRDMGMQARATVEPAGTGWLVRAPVVSETEAEMLAAALSRVQPRPGLRFTTDTEIREGVLDMLGRMAPDSRASLAVRPLGEGRFRVEGRMAKAADRDKLVRALSASYPQVAGWDNAVVANEEAAQALLADLGARGWQVQGTWKDDALQLQVTLQQREVPQWERALLAAASTNSVPFKATVALATPQAVAPGVEARLPFQVRSIVGGDMPYVLLTTGEKLAQGAVSQGWRLSAIDPVQLVFENGARRATVQR